MNIKDKLDIENNFKLIKNKLTDLKFESDLKFNLISLCDDYQKLSIEDLKKTEELLNRLINQINNDQNWNIQLKENILSLLTKIQNLISKFIVNSIIESVQF